MSAVYDRDLGGGLRGLIAGYRRGLLRRYPTMLFGGALLVLMIACALFAPLLFTSDPIAINPANRLKPPTELAWFGTVYSTPSVPNSSAVAPLSKGRSTGPTVVANPLPRSIVKSSGRKPPAEMPYIVLPS